jgi:hypothetical protein
MWNNCFYNERDFRAVYDSEERKEIFDLIKNIFLPLRYLYLLMGTAQSGFTM